jgi:hypothetical protein
MNHAANIPIRVIHSSAPSVILTGRIANELTAIFVTMLKKMNHKLYTQSHPKPHSNF